MGLFNNLLTRLKLWKTWPLNFNSEYKMFEEYNILELVSMYIVLKEYNSQK